MISSVRFCLSKDILNAILLTTKFVYFNENVHCCHGRRNDISCSRRKYFVTSRLSSGLSYRITVTSYDKINHQLRASRRISNI